MFSEPPRRRQCVALVAYVIFIFWKDAARRVRRFDYCLEAGYSVAAACHGAAL